MNCVLNNNADMSFIIVFVGGWKQVIGMVKERQNIIYFLWKTIQTPALESQHHLVGLVCFCNNEGIKDGKILSTKKMSLG